MGSPAIRVGDRVRIRLASRHFLGRVMDDRGPIGVGGRRLYLIAFEIEKDTPFEAELPAEDIEVVESRKETG